MCTSFRSHDGAYVWMCVCTISYYRFTLSLIVDRHLSVVVCPEVFVLACYLLQLVFTFVFSLLRRGSAGPGGTGPAKHRQPGG